MQHTPALGAAVSYLTYCDTSMLLLKGSEYILYSIEGVTQGDRDALCSGNFTTDSVLKATPQMAPKVGTLMILFVQGNYNWSRDWFDVLLIFGPPYGYFPVPSKCFIIVVPNDMPEAHSLLKYLRVTSHSILGGIIGGDN